jgi:hypothetical protein
MCRETGHQPNGSLRISPIHQNPACCSRLDSTGKIIELSELQLRRLFVLGLFRDIGQCRKCEFRYGKAEKRQMLRAEKPEPESLLDFPPLSRKQRKAAQVYLRAHAVGAIPTTWNGGAS